MKEWICTIAGIVGGFIATLFGGWDSALATLVVFMGIDFATGLVTAIMGKSKHSKSGALNSLSLIHIWCKDSIFHSWSCHWRYFCTGGGCDCNRCCISCRLCKSVEYQ